MNKLFGSLTDDDDNSSGSAKPDAGISALEISDLPEDERRVMNTLLRFNAGDGVTVETLQQELADLANLADVLSKLTGKVYIKSVQGEDGLLRYKANLRRKRGTGLLTWKKLLGDNDEQ
jgi:hypothetical protein